MILIRVVLKLFPSGHAVNQLLGGSTVSTCSSLPFFAVLRVSSCCLSVIVVCLRLTLATATSAGALRLAGRRRRVGTAHPLVIGIATVTVAHLLEEMTGAMIATVAPLLPGGMTATASDECWHNRPACSTARLCTHWRSTPPSGLRFDSFRCTTAFDRNTSRSLPCPVSFPPPTPSPARSRPLDTSPASNRAASDHLRVCDSPSREKKKQRTSPSPSDEYSPPCEMRQSVFA